MSELDRGRLSRMLQTTLTTDAEELDCEQLFDVMDKIVELANAGEDIRALLPDVALHLDHCPDCRDQYYTLIAFWSESAPARPGPIERVASLRRWLFRRG